MEERGSETPGAFATLHTRLAPSAFPALGLRDVLSLIHGLSVLSFYVWVNRNDAFASPGPEERGQLAAGWTEPVRVGGAQVRPGAVLRWGRSLGRGQRGDTTGGAWLCPVRRRTCVSDLTGPQPPDSCDLERKSLC